MRRMYDVRLACALTVLISITLALIVTPTYADDPPWPLPVGEQIIIREYPSFDEEDEDSPDNVGYIFVTDSSIWWELTRCIYATCYWRKLVRYDLGIGVEEEFPREHGRRPFMVTPDDIDVLFWDWAVEGEVDCLYHFHVPTQVLSCIFQNDSGEPAQDPDLDDPWLVWRSSAHTSLDLSYVMNWREESEPTVLSPDHAFSPRISYPWATWCGDWIGPGPSAYLGRARNLETGNTVEVNPVFRNMDVDGDLWVYPVGEYLLTHLYVLDLKDPSRSPRQISWDNGVERPRIHNKLVVWDYYDGYTGRSAIQGRDLETGLTFESGVRGGMHSYDVRNNIVAWEDPTNYPRRRVFIMLTRPYPLRGDMNGDNVVDVTDIALVAQHWRATEGSPGYDRGWDLNWDGKVDVVDIMLVVKHWGERRE